MLWKPLNAVPVVNGKSPTGGTWDPQNRGVLSELILSENPALEDGVAPLTWCS
jgi:hypothetical protein